MRESTAKNIPKKLEWLCAKCDGNVVPVKIISKGRGGMWCVCQKCGEKSPNMREVAYEKYNR